MFTAAMFIVCELPNMCKSRTTFYLVRRTGPSGLQLYGGEPTRLSGWPEMVKAYRLGSILIKNFLANEILFFQAALLNRLPGGGLPGQPAPYNQLVI